MKIILAAIYPYAFLLLFLIVPFDDYIRVLPNILLIILLIAFPFTVKKTDFKKLKSPSFYIFVSLFVYLVLSATFSGTIEEDWKVINKVGLAIGLVLLYIPIENFDKIEKAIIFSSLAAIIFSIYNFVLITDATGTFAIGDTPQVLESLLMDRLYLGMLSIFSILISCKYISKKFNPNNNYHAANIVVNILFVLLIVSKIAVVLLLVILVLRLFYKASLIDRGIIFVVLIVSVTALFFAYSGNDADKSSNAFIKNSVTWELRKAVWSCAQTLATSEGLLVTGLGFSNVKDELVTCYEKSIKDPAKRKEFILARYNTHNQFIDFYLSAGVIGIFLFVAFLIDNFLKNKNSYFKIVMWSTLVFYALFENVFHRQIGAYYIGFILIMLIVIPIQVQKTQIQDV